MSDCLPVAVADRANNKALRLTLFTSPLSPTAQQYYY